MTVETGRHAEGQAQTSAESDVRDRTSPSDPCTPGIGHPMAPVNGSLLEDERCSRN